MPTATKRSAQAKPSLRRMSAELAQLRSRVEELEDVRDLNAAIRRNAGKPGIPWAQARKKLGLV